MLFLSLRINIFDYYLIGIKIIANQKLSQSNVCVNDE